jgi:hypothetical protein
MISQNLKNTDAACLQSIIKLYIQLPDTPVKPSRNDIITAASLISQGVSLDTIEAALLLASVRRLARPDDAPPLPPVRSLAYFAPVIRELSDTPLPDGYRDYLINKLNRLAPK